MISHEGNTQNWRRLSSKLRKLDVPSRNGIPFGMSLNEFEKTMISIISNAHKCIDYVYQQKELDK